MLDGRAHSHCRLGVKAMCVRMSPLLLKVRAHSLWVTGEAWQPFPSPEIKAAVGIASSVKPGRLGNIIPSVETSDTDRLRFPQMEDGAKWGPGTVFSTLQSPGGGGTRGQ